MKDVYGRGPGFSVITYVLSGDDDVFSKVKSNKVGETFTNHRRHLHAHTVYETQSGNSNFNPKSVKSYDHDINQIQTQVH